MFTPRIPLLSLIEFCRAQRHLLESGLTLPQAMRQQAKRGPSAIRPVAARMADQLEKGHDLETALKPEAKRFPPIFVALSHVAEESGKLPEVFGELEEYFTLERQLRQRFNLMIWWPAFQFVAAVCVLTALIFILGIIAETHGDSPISVFGLKGTRDALLFFFGIIGALALLALLWSSIRGTAVLDRFLLSLPGIKGCLRSLALSRFALGLHLTTESGMPLQQAVRLSLEATGSAAFASRANDVAKRVSEGEELALALSGHELFPSEFLAIVETAELSGTVPEVMKKQARFYADEAAYRLKGLTLVIALMVWGLVALFIIFFIFQIGRQIFGVYDEALKAVG